MARVPSRWCYLTSDSKRVLIWAPRCYYVNVRRFFRLPAQGPPPGDTDSFTRAQRGEFHWAGSVKDWDAGGSGVTVGPVAGLA